MSKDIEDYEEEENFMYRRPSATTRRNSISVMFSTLSDYVCSMKAFAVNTIRPAQRKLSQIYQI